jgi:hypothetical protein
MKFSKPPYKPVEGKTYSLFGNTETSRGYYSNIRQLADRIVSENTDLPVLIDEIRKYSSKKANLKRSLLKRSAGTRTEEILKMIDPVLKIYTEKVANHLQTLSFSAKWDRTLSVSREQYHLYMIEIELTNRLMLKDFIDAGRKIALMPYCLQDFSTECRSARNGFDYQCRHCSGICFQNHASMILSAHSIEPYIWMEGNMKQLARLTLNENRTFGVFGIACIPELVKGMRNCMKNNIPVVGLPLNANRCRRWFGEFHPNSIDLDELEGMLSLCL